MESRLVVRAGVILALCLAGLAAQSRQNASEDTNSRLVEGVVVDAGNKPVSGAVVQLKDTKTLQIRSYITQEDGKYHFAGLSTNVDYQLKADHDGATSATKTVSLFSSKKTSVVELKLNK